jgi:hypothetical protein
VQHTLNAFLQKHHRVLFYSAWIILNLIQATSTELFDDEAYYWVYSIFPAWGYFDHPPVVAMLIKAGYAVFHNELGVRLLPLIFSTAAVYLVDSLIEKKNYLLFYSICASLAIIQVAGIMAVPDTPLMFFIAAFFWLYRRFIINMNFTNTLLLGICIALMLYTKYHGVLVVLFTALSNLKLFKHYQSYLAVIIALLLFTPHLYWQYANGYPSVQFHLLERYVADYNILFTVEFILGQILIAGPLIGWLLLAAATLHKPASLVEKAMKYSFVGFYLFFLLSTTKGRAEANWTIPAFISLMVLSHQYLLTHHKARKWLYYSVPFSLLLVFSARVLMIADTPLAALFRRTEFFQNRIWVNEVKQRAGDRPVVFLDSYQKPSKYWFYSGDTAMALNAVYYRRNNYNFWPIEDSLQGKEIYAVGPYDPHLLHDTFPSPRLLNLGSATISNYYSYSRVLIDRIKVNEIDNRIKSIRFRTITPPSYLALFQKTPFSDAAIYLSVYNKKELITVLPSNITVKDILKQEQGNIATFKFNDLPPGEYICKFSITSALPTRLSMNSSGFTVKLK